MSENQSDIRDVNFERSSSRSYFPDPLSFFYSLSRFTVVQSMHNFLGSVVSSATGLVSLGRSPQPLLEDSVRLTRFRDSQQDVI